MEQLRLNRIMIVWKFFQNWFKSILQCMLCVSIILNTRWHRLQSVYTHVCTCELFAFNSPANSVATCKERYRTERNIVAINLISNKIAAQPEIQANLAIFFLKIPRISPQLGDKCLTFRSHKSKSLSSTVKPQHKFLHRRRSNCIWWQNLQKLTGWNR